MADRQQSPDWIASGAASRLLGVDPATLRRWAAAGRVESYQTPGGHRRYSRAVVERVQASRTPPGDSAPAARAERIAAAYSRRVRGPSSPLPRAWVATLDAETVAAYRSGGRRVIAGMVEVLDALQAGGVAARRIANVLADIDTTAREAGADTARSGLPLTAALRVVMAVRRPLLAELSGQAGRRRLSAAETARIVIRGGDLLNRYLIAFVEGYETSSLPGRQRATAALPAPRAAAGRAAELREAAAAPSIARRPRAPREADS